LDFIFNIPSFSEPGFNPPSAARLCLQILERPRLGLLGTLIDSADPKNTVFTF